MPNNWLLNNNWSRDQEKGVNVVDFDTDVMKIALTTVTQVPAPDTDTTFDNTNEVSGTNYTAGGETVGSMTVTNVTVTTTVDGGSVNWAQSASGFTDARIAWFFKSGGTTVVVATLDLGSDFGNVDSDIIIALPNGFYDKVLS